MGRGWAFWFPREDIEFEINRLLLVVDAFLDDVSRWEDEGGALEQEIVAQLPVDA